ncbi:MAG: chloride channel protein, partial [Alistipes sp.]|nr:chloride channel protein [Alistipes sp.]
MKYERQIKNYIYDGYLAVSRRLSEAQTMAILAIVVGLCAGLGAYIFNTLLHTITHLLTSWTPVDRAQWLYLIYPAIGIILATLFVKRIVKDGISEGVTRVLYAMSRNNSRIKGHNTWTSIVGGATTIGFGGSVGPEAPIVLTGAAIGSNIGKLARLNYKNITLMLCCGAGAAVAAIFKAPITGVVFVLEILMLDITSKSIIPLLLASMTATITSLVLHGFSPIIAVSLSHSDMFQVEQVPLFILLGCFCGIMAFYFTSVNSKVGGFYKSINQQWRKWLYAGITLGVLIFIFPPLYGEGHSSFGALMTGDTESLFNHTLFHSFSHTDWFLIIYLIAVMLFKVIAMATTNAAGGVGGTFAPSLFVGAFAGATIAVVCQVIFGWDVSITSFTLAGMAGVMSGVMKAPLTAIFLIAELSNGYGLFIPLMIVSCISFAVNFSLDRDSIYTKQLRLRGELLTHDKDSSAFVFLRLDQLMETDFIRLRESITLGDVVNIISNARRNIFPVVDHAGKLL